MSQMRLWGTGSKSETDGISNQGQPWLPRPLPSLLVLYPKVKWERRHISVPQWTHNQSGKWKHMPLLINYSYCALTASGACVFPRHKSLQVFEWYLGKKKEFQATERCSWEFYRAGYAQWLYWVCSVCVCVCAFAKNIKQYVLKTGSFLWVTIYVIYPLN